MWFLMAEELIRTIIVYADEIAAAKSQVRIAVINQGGDEGSVHHDALKHLIDRYQPGLNSRCTIDDSGLGGTAHEPIGEITLRYWSKIGWK